MLTIIFDYFIPSAVSISYKMPVIKSRIFLAINHFNYVNKRCMGDAGKFFSGTRSKIPPGFSPLVLVASRPSMGSGDSATPLQKFFRHPPFQ